MTNAEKFKVLFGIYATELWAMSEAKFLEWLNAKTENSSEKPNNCEDLQDWKDRMWAEAIVTEPTISKMEQVDKDINVRSKDEPQTDCTEALTLLWIKNMVTDEEFYRIDARLKCISCKWWNDTISGGSECVSKECTYQPKDEPQTDWHYDEQDATWYPYKHEDEPQTVETMSCAECKHRPIGAEICEEPCHYEPKEQSGKE